MKSEFIALTLLLWCTSFHNASANSLYLRPHVFTIQQDFGGINEDLIAKGRDAVVPVSYKNFEAKFVGQPTPKAKAGEFAMHSATISLNSRSFEVPSSCLQDQIAPPFNILISPYGNRFVLHYSSKSLENKNVQYNVSVLLENIEDSNPVTMSCDIDTFDLTSLQKSGIRNPK